MLIYVVAVDVCLIHTLPLELGNCSFAVWPVRSTHATGLPTVLFWEIEGISNKSEFLKKVVQKKTHLENEFLVRNAISK